MALQQTARTQYVDAANGVRFAYRRLGVGRGVPLVMHIHYRANMDLWDPLLVNALGVARPVIIFDQAGVGRSSGEVSETFQGWADHVIAFVQALNLKKLDLLGFSMGGAAVQMVALTAPELIRKLILAGTTASAPSSQHVPGVVWPREECPPEPIRALSGAATVKEGADAIAYSFFYDDAAGRAAAAAYWDRLGQRSAEPLMLELLDRDNGAKRQMAASLKNRKPDPSSSFHRLGELQIPVLVANGDHDVLYPSSRSWELYTQIANAQLIMDPRAGHGFLWQLPELFAKHINLFLDGDEYEGPSSRL
jgi:pimeloyl-ACP methyl ester carboxylesterase